jgi:hypothetical protein
MVQTTATTVSDELQLAQFACAKLARLVQGAVSIALPAFATGTPEPGPFLQDRFRVLHAFALVLHTICWPAGHSQETLRLREKSSKLMSLLGELERQLAASLASSESLGAMLRPAQATASALFDLMDEYAKLVRQDGDSILKAKAVVMEVFDAMANLDTAHALSSS